MRVVVITAPEPVVTLEEVKRHLRLIETDGDGVVLPNEEDGYVEALIASAQQWIDGPGGWLGRSIGVQTLELRTSVFCDAISLPYGPILSIESVKHLDGTGAEITVDPTFYETRGWLIGSSFGKRWPSLGADDEAVRIRYRAGYETIPAPIKQAILLLVGQWYSFRSNVAEDGAPAEMPMAAEALLSTYRVWL